MKKKMDNEIENSAPIDKLLIAINTTIKAEDI